MSQTDKVVILTGWIIAGGIILFIILLLACPVRAYFEYGSGIRLKVKYLFFTLYRIPEKPKRKPKTAEKKKKSRKSEKADKSKATEQRQIPAEPAEVAGNLPEVRQTEITLTAEKTEIKTIPKEPKEEAHAEKISEEKDKSDKPQKESGKDTGKEKQKSEKGKAKEKSDKGKKEKDPKIPTLEEIFELIKVFVDSLSKPLKKLLKRIHICNLDIRMLCGGEDAAKAALNFGKANLFISNALGQLGCWFTLKKPHVSISVDFHSEKTVTEVSCVVKLSALTLLAFVFTFVGRLITKALKNIKVKAYLKRVTGK